MRRLLPVLALALGAVFVPSAGQADGCPPATCGTTSTAPPGSSLVFVRPSGREGPLEAYSVNTGARLFRLLTYGLLSADGRTFLSSVPLQDRSTVRRWDARSGRVVRRWSVRGYWGVGGATPDGRVVAYVRGLQNALVLRIRGRRYILRGSFEVEAVSPDGRRIYLVHWRRHGYDLQQLDLTSGRLSPTRLDDPEEKMSGTAITAVATRDGHWLLTLYAKSSGGSFVHALDLRTGIAHCIDLSVRGDYFALGSTALTLSPDERRLYLASPYLGRVTTVDLERLEQVRVVRFRVPDAVVELATAPSGAITANGRMLAFSGGGSVWLYDTAYGVVRRAFRGTAPVRGIGFRPDGRSVLAIRASAAPMAFDAATGARLR